MEDEAFIQGTEDWKQLRRTKITGTDAAIILGLSIYCTPNLLWRRKLGLEPEQELNFAMSEGSRMEPSALKAFNAEIGMVYKPAVVINPRRTWQMSSLDGITECGLWIVELKCSAKILCNALNEIIDPIYYAQCQHHMSVCELQSCYFFAYCRGNYKLKTILRDDAFIEDMIEKEKLFHDSLQTFHEPECTDKDYKRIDDREFQIRVEMYKEAKIEAKYWKEKEDLYKSRIVEYAGGESAIGGGHKLSRYEVKGRVDYDSVPELKGIDLDPYRKRSTHAFKITEIT